MVTEITCIAFDFPSGQRIVLDMPITFTNYILLLDNFVIKGLR